MDDHKVAVLLEDLMSQFRTFGEGQQILIDRMDRLETTIIEIKNDLRDLRIENQLEHKENRQEHQQFIQMVKELDYEVKIELKRVK